MLGIGSFIFSDSSLVFVWTGVYLLLVVIAVGKIIIPGSKRPVGLIWKIDYVGAQIKSDPSVLLHHFANSAIMLTVCGECVTPYHLIIN